MTAKELVFACLRAELDGAALSAESVSELREEQLVQALELAERHDMAHLVAHRLITDGLLSVCSDELRARAESIFMTAVFRHGRRAYTCDRAVAALSRAEIRHIPLKGAVLQDFYPQPWMRTSCDIDILVRAEELERAVEALCADGFRVEKRDGHDICLALDEGIHLELHFAFIEEGRFSEATDLLDSAWESAEPVDSDGYRLLMKRELFYLYILAHAAKHIENGGCGIRPFADLYLAKRKYPPDRELLESLLSDCGLLAFYRAAEALSAYWLEGDRPDRDTLLLEVYILEAGTYGSLKNRLSSVRMYKGGGVRYLCRRLFPPYGQMKTQYALLSRLPILLPVFWPVRWIRILAEGRAGGAAREINTLISADSDSISSSRELMDRLGLGGYMNETTRRKKS